MLWLALVFPGLPLQLHLRGQAAPELIAITESRPRPHVIAVAPAAAARGIQAGQSVTSALAMAPELNLVPRTPDEEAALLREVAAWAGAFSARVCLDPPDGIVLEVASCLRLFGGLGALRHTLLEGLQRQGLTPVIADAPTPLAARWFAREAGRNPAAVCTKPPSAWQQRLDALPLSALADRGDIGQTQLDLLSGLGLRTLGEVRALPAAGLARRQATAVIDALARAYGEEHDLREAYLPPPSYSSHISLALATTCTEPLLFAARRLFAGLASWLAARHAGIDHCQLVLLHERRPASILDILTGTPSRDEARFNLLARERLAVLKLPAPVDGLELVAHAPRALAARSDDLFGDAVTARENALLLLERLRARLGDDGVRQIAPNPDWRPERAWRGSAPNASNKAARVSARARVDTQRPLWLLDAPQHIDDPRQIKLLRGPERIEQGWWDGHDVRRDYYLARHANGALWWVYRKLDPPRDWYLQGYFG